MQKIITILSLACLLLTGCAGLDKTGPYQGDKVSYSADLIISSSYVTLDAFLKFEEDNRVALASHPEVKKAADDIRVHAKQWISSAIILRDAYHANPTTSNASALNSAIAVLTAALTEATKYLVPNNAST